jgi:hypothetical protein
MAMAGRHRLKRAVTSWVSDAVAMVANRQPSQGPSGKRRNPSWGVVVGVNDTFRLISLKWSGISTTTSSTSAPQPSAASIHPIDDAPTTRILTLLRVLLPTAICATIAIDSPLKMGTLGGPRSSIDFIPPERRASSSPSSGLSHFVLFKVLMSFSCWAH